MKENLAEILLPLPFDQYFSYRIPENLEDKIAEGSFVIVPFGNRKLKGVVWGFKQEIKENFKIKDIEDVIDVLPLSQNLRKLIDFTSSYYLAKKGAVLKMVMSPPDALKAEEPIIAYSLNDRQIWQDILITKPREKLIDFFGSENKVVPGEILKHIASSAVINKAAAIGILKQVSVFRSSDDFSNINLPPLSDGQQEIYQNLVNKLQKGFSSTLFEGVTGSGKTEIYFYLIQNLLENCEGAQTLIMIPEIILTSSFVKRFEERFAAPATLWHSSLTKKQKIRNWQNVHSGKARIVIGTRSSLFLPFANLKLIIIDEEHDGSFKQEEGVIYHARDIAVARANFEKIPIILASATPSIESFINVRSGKYDYLKLEARFGAAILPEITLVDLKSDKLPKNKWISEKLQKGISESLNNSEQAMLFLNRRGYAPLIICRDCGFRMKCSNCSSWLVEHKNSRKLKCHHCDYNIHLPKNCPSCKAEESLAACGPGVERIQEEVELLFPEAKVILVTSDSVKTLKDIKNVTNKIEKREVDIIVGTQLIAKGHHFPALNLVGVIDADLGLDGGDPRSSERIYQLLSQVSGRAGRESKKGKVLIQTHHPESLLMQTIKKHDQESFVDFEIKSRKLAQMPPFSKFAAIIISGVNERQVKAHAENLSKLAPISKEIQILGPIPAPLQFLKRRYRYRILVKADKNINLQKFILHLSNQLKTPANIKVKVDIDPYYFM